MKKRIVAMLLALTLAVTSIPVGITTTGVHAAETTETIETNAFYVSADGKAVGTDGVAYEDVVYLSAGTVEALGVEGQNAYVEICDRIAEEKKAGDCIENVVIAVDENGNLIFQREIPVKALQNSMEKLAEGFSEDIEVLNEDVEEDNVQLLEEVEEFPTEKNIEMEIAVEDKSEEYDLEDGDSHDENTINETETENVAAEIPKAEVSADEVIFVDGEELSTEKDLTKGDLAEEVSTQGSVADEAAAVEDASAEESESAADVLTLTAENMDLIGGYETEEFEIVENAEADILLDLGYDKTGDVLQFYSILPQSDWFSSQLTKSQASIYNACKVMGKGTNTFTITPSSIPSDVDICQAISAYIMTEPYKCDWMDLTKAPSIVDYYLVDTNGKKTYNKKTTITLPKSKYCTSAIQKQANAKVLELAAEAQNYAEQNYPDSPVYGVVEYFDKWICENNEYDYRGVLGGNSTDKTIQEAYYYCHSSYGILLKGYGVCESYALAMTRLLDAVGIPNMYATGIGNKGGHAWNYVGMPDGKWYLQDSTWNDVGVRSDKAYLLCADDANLDTGHKPQGSRYAVSSGDFRFVDRASSNYAPTPGTDEIILSLKNDVKPVSELNLLAKKSAELTYDNGHNTYISNENIPKVWSSSNEKVAKVDKNGKVTAAAPGSAEITLTAAGITAVCKVNVHQINSITFDESKKASLTTSCGIAGRDSAKKEISLTVNQKAENPVYTAEQLNDKGVFDDFSVESANESIVKVNASSVTLEGNKINFAITPVAEGKTKVIVTFGTKKATLNVSAGKMLDKTWFKLDDVEKYVKEGNDGTLMYTGKAYKPKVELSETGKAEKVKFKVSYLNNKDAGTASVIIVGSGSHGGELRYDFTINPLVLNVDLDSIKVTEKSLYNGGVNLTKSTVKHIDNSGKKPKLVGLKAGKDYVIQYTDKKGNMTTQPTEVGEYTMTIVGKGNYSGGANIPKVIPDKKWIIDPIDIKKAKVTVKVNGRKPDVTVAIGKNILSEKTAEKAGDYKLTFYKDKECKEQVNVFAAKSQYYVKVEGGVGPNLTNMNPVIKNFKTR